MAITDFLDSDAELDVSDRPTSFYRRHRHLWWGAFFQVPSVLFWLWRWAYAIYGGGTPPAWWAAMNVGVLAGILFTLRRIWWHERLLAVARRLHGPNAIIYIKRGKAVVLDESDMAFPRMVKPLPPPPPPPKRVSK